MLFRSGIDCVDGVQVERTSSGRIRYLRIDLDTHPYVVSILQERGLVNGSLRKDDEFDEDDESWLIPTQAVEVDCRNIKWSKKLLESFEQSKNGEVHLGDINNFWRLGEDIDEI